MTEALFRDYWWIMFPIFGMAMAFWGMFSSERRTKSVLDLIKTYADQGKEPPAELLRLATQEAEATQSQQRQGNGWSFVVFAALAAGFGVGWYMVQGQDYAFAFLIVAVTMGVMAAGSLLVLLFSRSK
jgi:Flp pilus assembly protein TadB